MYYSAPQTVSPRHPLCRGAGSLQRERAGGGARARVRMLAALFVPVLLLGLLFATASAQEGWAPVITGHAYSPGTMVAVDKRAQTFMLLTHQSPLRVVGSYPCTTGQALGDKTVKGDLRTPEGVYFVGDRVPRGLDFELYGDIAYTLNYPNPVDQLKGKTGSGIWIHGRGKRLVPRDTRGCVAMSNPDISSLAPMLTPGTPVVIASRLSIEEQPGLEAKTAEAMAELVQRWARDWQDKSEDLFSLYDPERFARTTRASFSEFVDRKHSIFARQPWIQVMVGNLRAMPGPDYWVTWFDQYYRTASTASTVGKRLYWMRGSDGSWRIVGQEYVTASEDLAPKYLAAKIPEVEKLVAAWSEAWQSGDLDAYMSCYDGAARQGSRNGAQTIADYKRGLWQSRPPALVGITDLSIRLCPEGLEAEFVQEYRDALGHSDRGSKRLILAPLGNGWRIVDEQWRRLS